MRDETAPGHVWVFFESGGALPRVSRSGGAASQDLIVVVAPDDPAVTCPARGVFELAYSLPEFRSLDFRLQLENSFDCGMRARPSTFRTIAQDLIDLFRTEKPVRILVCCASPTTPHGINTRGGWVLVTIVLPGKFRCAYTVVFSKGALPGTAEHSAQSQTRCHRSEPALQKVSHLVSICSSFATQWISMLRNLFSAPSSQSRPAPVPDWHQIVTKEHSSRPP